MDLERKITIVDGAENTNPVFILSYKTIVYLTHLGLDGSTIKGINLTCSSYVRNQLLNDNNKIKATGLLLEDIYEEINFSQ